MSTLWTKHKKKQDSLREKFEESDALTEDLRNKLEELLGACSLKKWNTEGSAIRATIMDKEYDEGPKPYLVLANSQGLSKIVECMDLTKEEALELAEFIYDCFGKPRKKRSKK